jgi:hypothetical protein
MRENPLENPVEATRSGGVRRVRRGPVTPGGPGVGI